MPVVVARGLVLGGLFVLASVAAVFPPHAAGYTPHAPIIVDGNANFTPANGVVAGSGSSADPYVIADWEITADIQNGIHLRNTDAHVVIRDVFVRSDGASTTRGISLENASNVRVEGALLTSNYMAVEVWDSDHVFLTGLEASLGGFGAFVRGSEYVTIVDSNLSENYSPGLTVDVSSSVMIANSTIGFNAAVGIRLTGGSNVLIDGVRIVGNDFEGVYSWGVQNLTVARSVITSNRDWAIYSYGGTAEVFSDNDISSNALGAYLSQGTSFAIRNNTFRNHPDLAVWLITQTDGEVSGNTFINSSGGVEIGWSRDVRVSNNSFDPGGVGLFGSSLEDFRSHEITPDNTVQGWPIVFRRDCNGVRLQDVRVGQVLIANCTDVTISSVATSASFVGVELAYVRGAVVANSSVTSHYGHGLMLQQTDGISIVDNAIEGNGWYGISLMDSVGAVVARNHVSSHIQRGVSVDFASAEVTQNVVRDNGIGVYVGRASVEVTENTLSRNGVGAYVELASSALVYHNNFLGDVGEDQLSVSSSWDAGYPEGGNYWQQYAGPDICSGPNQDVCPDPDGMGDAPYSVDADTQDRYPLMDLFDGPPFASFSVVPPSGNTSTDFAFDASASWDLLDPITSLTARWDWEGDAIWDTLPSVTKTASHRFAVPGTYTVRLEIGDSRGLTGTASQSVEIGNRPPVADFRVTPEGGQTRVEFTFDSSASYDIEDAPGFLEVRWDWEGDGTWDAPWSTDRVARHTFGRSGVYVSKLVVRDTLGTSNETTRQVAVENTPPEASLTAVPPSGEVGLVFTFDASTSTDFEDRTDLLTVRWDWEDDGTWDTDWTATKDAQHRYNVPGIHTVRVEVADSEGGSDAASLRVRVVAATGPQGGPEPWLVVAAVSLSAAAIAVVVFLYRRRSQSRPPDC